MESDGGKVGEGYSVLKKTLWCISGGDGRLIMVEVKWTIIE